MTDHRFATPQPLQLDVEVERGHVSLVLTDTTETTVRLEGADAAGTEVSLEGTTLRIHQPRRRGFFSGDRTLHVEVEAPRASSLAARLGSTDLHTEGPLSDARVKSGSGDLNLAEVTGACQVDTGSGAVQVHRAGAELRVRSGSGDVHVGHAGATSAVSTGSGDVQVDHHTGTLSVKTGSGDLRVIDAAGEVSMATGSGDAVVDRISTGALGFTGASGDVRIGVAPGIPVWTEVSTVTGRLESRLQGRGEPAQGDPFVVVRARTVSGDIVLQEA